MCEGTPSPELVTHNRLQPPPRGRRAWLGRWGPPSPLRERDRLVHDGADALAAAAPVAPHLGLEALAVVGLAALPLIRDSHLPALAVVATLRLPPAHALVPDYIQVRVHRFGYDTIGKTCPGLTYLKLDQSAEQIAYTIDE
eukprot:2268297-Pyramimonas_sp.AAC.2